MSGSLVNYNYIFSHLLCCVPLNSQLVSSFEWTGLCVLWIKFFVMSDNLVDNDHIFLFRQLAVLWTGILTHTQEVSCLWMDMLVHTSGLNFVWWVITWSIKISNLPLFPTCCTVNWCLTYSGGKLQEHVYIMRFEFSVMSDALVDYSHIFPSFPTSCTVHWCIPSE